MAGAAAEVHLRAGHDVVVPQFVARSAFLERREEFADRTWVDFHEIVLLAGRPTATILRTTHGRVDDAYRALLAALGDRAGPRE